MIRSRAKFLMHLDRTTAYQHNCGYPSAESEERFEKDLMAKKESIDRMKDEYRRGPNYIEGLPMPGDSRRYRTLRDKCADGKKLSEKDIRDAMYLVYHFPHLEIVKAVLRDSVKAVHEHPAVWKGKGNYILYKNWCRAAKMFVDMCGRKLGIRYEK